MTNSTANSVETTTGEMARNPVIDVLRVLSQFFVVGSHAIYLVDWIYALGFASWTLPLVRNSTVFFMFMSGYLFALGLPRYSFKGLWKKRFRTVMVPYLICLIPMVVIYTMDAKYRTDVKAWAALIFTGANFVNRALWFFPLILSFYLISPISARVYRHEKSFLGLVFATMIVSFLVHRPTFVENLHHSLLYFLFPYYAGMALFRYEKQVFAFMKKGHWFVLLALIGVVAWQADIGPEWRARRGYQTYRSLSEVTWKTWDLSAIQKTLIFFLSYYYLSVSERALRVFKPLEWFSPYCFGIHLYHGYLMSLYMHYFLLAPSKNVVSGFFLAWIGFWFASVAFVVVISKLTGRRSIHLFGH